MYVCVCEGKCVCAMDGKQVEGGRSDQTHSNRGESVAQAEQQHIGLHTDEYTHTRTHTSTVAWRTAGKNVCVCVCPRAFHLMHASAFARAGTICFCVIFCFCVCVSVHLRLCKYVCAGERVSLQTGGVCVCVSTSTPPLFPSHPPVWRQEVEEVLEGAEGLVEAIR